jgi:hypothetical protein
MAQAFNVRLCSPDGYFTNIGKSGGLTRVNLHSYLTESQFSNLSYELLLLRVLLWYLVE